MTNQELYISTTCGLDPGLALAGKHAMHCNERLHVCVCVCVCATQELVPTLWVQTSELLQMCGRLAAVHSSYSQMSSISLCLSWFVFTPQLVA